jgi:hypothetical protein
VLREGSDFDKIADLSIEVTDIHIGLLLAHSLLLPAEIRIRHNRWRGR